MYGNVYYQRHKETDSLRFSFAVIWIRSELTHLLTVKSLDLAEVKAIYDTHMRDTFPPSELRPYKSIKALTNSGNYFCYGLYDEDSLQAYAFFSRAKNRTYCLLDYYAVIESLRGSGIGSQFFPLLREKLQHMDGILLEVESVESTENEEEQAIRQRRIRFYQRNGCVMTGVKCHLYGVDYRIMAMPAAKPVPEDRSILSELESIYHVMFNDLLYPLVCRPFIQKAE